MAARSKNLSVCTQCHQTSTAELRGLGWIELILWCCYIVPGLLYSVWRRGKKHNICPACSGAMVPLVTPKAKEIVGEEKYASFLQEQSAIDAAEAKIRKRDSVIMFVLIIVVVGVFLWGHSVPR